jgi:CRISPR-associated protein Cmr2
MTVVCRWLKRVRGGALPVADAAGAPQIVDSDIDRRLLFSLGPVQGFIAEARRTRDVWAGSFLLSWLSAIAMREIAEAAGSEDCFRLPRLERDPLYRGLINGNDEVDYQASLPNHCEVLIPAGKPFDPNVCAKAVQAKWHALADKVWTAFLEPALSGNALDKTWDIWTRQIGDEHKGPFWEVQWVLVPASDPADDWLERRKLWRTWPDLADEEPDLCTMMGDWQELSGHNRATPAGKTAQAGFWQDVREHIVEALDRGKTLIELRDAERLCAISFVKRMFPLLPPGTLAKVIEWPAPATGPKGRRIDNSYRPSTAYLAAGHWLERAWKDAQKECKDFAKQLGGVQDTLALRLAERADRLRLVPGHPPFAQIDGKMFFEGSYQAETELKQIEKDDKDKLLKALAAIADVKITVGGKAEETVGRPSPYYAVLRMDGDSMGTFAENKLLPVMLAMFANRVRKVVPEYHGELVFAGGDDLLALLPLEDALDAAIALRAEWARWVERRIPGATISAGLVYVHYEVALRWALEEARRQLDGIAKEVNGRDSLAISVMGRRGPALSWATTWGTEAGQADLAEALKDLVKNLPGSAAAFGDNRFVYGMNERLGAFTVGPLASRKKVLAAGDTAWPALSPGEDAALLRAVGGEAAEAIGDTQMENLLKLLPPSFRDDNKVHRRRANPLQLDLLLLLRFLATEWRSVGPS